MKKLTLKHYMTLVLILSGIIAICFDSLSKGFVTFAPHGTDEYIYLRDMPGSADDDSVLLSFFGIASILLGAIMYFVKNMTYVLRIGFLYMLLYSYAHL